MIYYLVRMMEHDKYLKTHEYKERKFKTLKEASVYATREKMNYWKTIIIRWDTANTLDYHMYEEIQHGKWKRVI